MIPFGTQHASQQKGADNRGRRVVRFSDLTNKIIEDDEVVRIVVEQHPALENGPVEIEASKDEVEPIRNRTLEVVSLKIFMDEGSAPEVVTMEIEAFNKLAGDMDMADVIRRAQPAYPPRRQTKTAAASTVDKLDYASLDHAGKPHRGKTTDAEKETVRNNLDKITSALSATVCERSDWMVQRWWPGMGWKLLPRKPATSSSNRSCPGRLKSAPVQRSA